MSVTRPMSVTRMSITNADEVFTQGDAIVVELMDDTNTFVAANKVGREATHARSRRSTEKVPVLRGTMRARVGRTRGWDFYL